MYFSTLYFTVYTYNLTSHVWDKDENREEDICINYIKKIETI